MMPGPRLIHLSVLGEVTGGTGSIAGAHRGLRGAQTQPQRVVADISRLGGAGSIAPRVGGGPLVGGELGRLLIASLRLARHATNEAQLGHTDRQPVRLRPGVRRCAAQASAPRSSSATSSNAVRHRPSSSGPKLEGSAQARHQRRWRDRASTDSPASSSRSTPYWRIVSKARYRVAPDPAMAISRLWSASPARIVGTLPAGTGGQSASTSPPLSR